MYHAMQALMHHQPLVAALSARRLSGVDPGLTFSSIFSSNVQFTWSNVGLWRCTNKQPDALYSPAATQEASANSLLLPSIPNEQKMGQ